MKLISALAKPFNLRRGSVREELTDLIETSMKDEASFDNHESALLKNMLGLRDITAEDVMVPRADIISVDITEDFDTVAAQISAANHSRVPANDGKMDSVRGMLHLKDLLPHLLNQTRPPLEKLLRPVLFVSPSIRLLDLLQEMRLRRRHLALVVDEFGGVDGLITIEDLVEEIVGEIEDEHDDTAPPRFEQAGDGTAIADARLELDRLEAVTGRLLDEEDRDEIDTLGGLVFALAGRVPVRGEVIRHASGLVFEVLEGDPRRITLLRIEGLAMDRMRAAPAPAAPAEGSAGQSAQTVSEKTR